MPSILQAQTPTLARTFNKTLALNPMNCRNLKGRTYPATPGSGGHTLQQLELLDTHLLFTHRCPRCEMTYPQYETPPVN
ncbi:hypothetical protein QUA89_31615 [Microcoleus sp. F10-B4]|uniref:hypothetical protein n=2 Tax=unclassified Microcoleus TaxID=2642155 RepID=UPI002FD14D64